MSGDSVRCLKVNIQQKDCKKLSAHNWQLQVAKSVVVKGQLQFNIVWKSTTLAPTTELTWVPHYGLNWTSTLPTTGINVRCGGQWSPCELGQVLEVDEDGYFVNSEAAADPAALKIGTSRYKSMNTEGIRIVVGVQNGSGTYDPIFVDPTPIGRGMSATYQPQEKLQWWYETGDKTGTMFTDHETTQGTGDFSAPDRATGTFKKSTEYDYDEGVWITKSIKC